MNVFDRLVAAALPLLPRALVWRVARRYIAGTGVDDALETVRAIARSGCRATLDILGEDVHDEQLASEARDAYCSLLERVEAAGLPSGISVKLSQLGARFSEELTRSNVEAVVRCAADRGRFVRIDMEDSSLTSLTLATYAGLAREHRNVGVVLQAYLRRSADDLRELMPLGPDVRICKGIYREPPSIAFTGRDEIRESFLRLLDILLEGGGRAAVATHDPPLVDAALERFARLPAEERERHEFQMLLGVGDALRPGILEAGMRLRIYVPFGERWHAYSLRRLRENPAIAGYVFRDLFGPRR